MTKGILNFKSKSWKDKKQNMKCERCKFKQNSIMKYENNIMTQLCCKIIPKINVGHIQSNMRETTFIYRLLKT